MLGYLPMLLADATCRCYSAALLVHLQLQVLLMSLLSSAASCQQTCRAIQSKALQRRLHLALPDQDKLCVWSHCCLQLLLLSLLSLTRHAA
jgi:hypothetical protein